MVLGIVTMAGSAATVLGSTVIDTTPRLPGFSAVFGPAGTPTFGETITAPAIHHTLQDFSFFVLSPTDDKYRAEVYAWDGAKATGAALFESGTVSTTDDSSWQQLGFSTGGTALTPGAQYVVFLTSSKDSPQPNHSGMIAYASTPYAGGQAFGLDVGVAAWTTTPWAARPSFANNDLAFTATFDDVDVADAAAAPLPSAAWGGLALCGLSGMVRVRRAKA